MANYCYIQDKIEKRPALFTLWPAQLRILPDLFSAPLLAVLKARQLGLTWLSAAYCLWVVIFQPMKLVVVISAKGDWAVEFIDRVYFILRRLPTWMISDAKGNRVTKETTEILTIRHKNGDSTIKSLTTTEAGAQSKTPDVLILDETCWNPYISAIYNASKPGIEAAGGRIIVISNSIKTAPGWGWTRDIYINSMQGLNDFKRIFMPWQDRPGRSETFRADQIRGGMDEQDVIEHYPETEEEAISTIGGSYFGRTLERHSKPIVGILGSIRRNPKRIYEWAADDKGILEVWRFPYHQIEGFDDIPWALRYCIGSDVSEGLGQSYSVAYVYDRLLQEFVARIRSNRVDAHRWAQMLYDLSEFYSYGRETGLDDPAHFYDREKALICVETTGAGQTTVHELKMLNANLYVQLTGDKVGSEVTRRFGWHESNQAKHDLSEDLRNYFRTTTGKVYCGVLLNECSTWIKRENGTIGPEDDSKLGDCVVAAGLAIQADIFMGATPKQIQPPLTGWRRERVKKGESNWVL